jgi:hemoglobin-like flavoprotein
VTSMADDRVKAAIDVVARHAIHEAVGEVDWEDYPKVGERDWGSVEARIAAMLGERPTWDAYEAAYEFLAGRAVDWDHPD